MAALVGVRETSKCGQPRSDERSHEGGVPALATLPGLPDTAPVQPTIAQLTDKLVESYTKLGGINHVDGKNLPSKFTVATLTEQLLCLLFPGFFEEQLQHASELKANTEKLLNSVKTNLEAEIAKALEYNPPSGVAKKDVRTAAQSLTLQFLGSLPSVRELLQTDIEAAYNGDPAALSREEVIVAYPFVECIGVQLMAHELYLKHVPLIPRIMTEWAHSRTGTDLHPGAKIGTHFFVDHCTGTVIGETSEIGNHVKLYQGVGLVARSLAAGQRLRGKKRHPTVEDHVTIYAGATIVGGETVVGAHSTIGASVFLTHSVPPHSLVVQEDPNVKILRKREQKSEALDWQI
jgi:serine O-acetyltransferase